MSNSPSLEGPKTINPTELGVESLFSPIPITPTVDQQLKFPKRWKQGA